MRRSGVEFSMGGIPIRVEASFVLVMALLGFSVGDLTALAIWIGVVFVSVLVHELGHAVAFRQFGMEAKIMLYGFGGLTSGRMPDQGASDGARSTGPTPQQSILISLAGPAAGFFLLGIPAFVADQLFDITDVGINITDVGIDLAVALLILVNLVWSLVNLLPILPLDGGNVVLGAFQMARRPDALRLTRIISTAVAGVAAVAALALGYIFASAFALMFLFTNFQGIKTPATEARLTDLVEARKALIALDLIRARELAGRVLAGRPSALERATALETIAWAQLLSVDVVGSRTTLSHRPDLPFQSRALEGSLALAEGRRDEGLSVIAWCFLHEQARPEKLLAATVAARLGSARSLAELLLSLSDGEAHSTLEATRILASLLHHSGRYDDAAAVGYVLWTDGRAPRVATAQQIADSLREGGYLRDASTWSDIAVGNVRVLDSTSLPTNPT